MVSENLNADKIRLDARQRMLNDTHPAVPPDGTCAPPPHPLHLPEMGHNDELLEEVILYLRFRCLRPVHAWARASSPLSHM